jgi:AhpD family alkylhydroperoxidase
VLLLGAFDRVLSYIIFSAVLFLALTASTLFRMKEPVRAWWFPAAPILFIVFLRPHRVPHSDARSAARAHRHRHCALRNPTAETIRLAATALPLTPKGADSMPHIQLPEGLPGIRGAMAYRPETAKPLNELAEILLHQPNSLPAGDRELIATYVSYLNDCYFCQTAHGAIAAAHLERRRTTGQAREGGFSARRYLRQAEGIAGDREQGAEGRKACDRGGCAAKRAPRAQRTSKFTIRCSSAAAFCMYNRYVDGLATWQPREEELYRQRGKKTARDGYVAVSKEYIPQYAHAAHNA